MMSSSIDVTLEDIGGGPAQRRGVGPEIASGAEHGVDGAVGVVVAQVEGDEAADVAVRVLHGHDEVERAQAVVANGEADAVAQADWAVEAVKVVGGTVDRNGSAGAAQLEIRGGSERARHSGLAGGEGEGDEGGNHGCSRVSGKSDFRPSLGTR